MQTLRTELLVVFTANRHTIVMQERFFRRWTPPRMLWIAVQSIEVETVKRGFSGRGKMERAKGFEPSTFTLAR